MPLLETKGAGSAQGFGANLLPPVPPPITQDQYYDVVSYAGVTTNPLVKTTTVNTTTDPVLLFCTHAQYPSPSGLSQSSYLTLNEGQNTSTGLYYNTIVSNTGASFSTGAIPARTSTSISVAFANYGLNSGTHRCIHIFRKRTKFFDIVVYTGDGTSSRTLAHSLGCEVGAVLISTYDSTSITYNPGTSAMWIAGTSFYVGGTAVTGGSTQAYGSISATSASDFTVVSGSSGTDSVNKSGVVYRALVFANNSDADTWIKSGSWTGTGVTKGSNSVNFAGDIEINIGFKPRFMFVYSPQSTGNFTGLCVLDDDLSAQGGLGLFLAYNAGNYEYARAINYAFTPNGIKISGASGYLDDSGATYSYLAVKDKRFYDTLTTANLSNYFNIKQFTANNTTSREFLLGNKAGLLVLGSRATGFPKWIYSNTTLNTIWSLAASSGTYSAYANTTALQGIGGSFATSSPGSFWAGRSAIAGLNYSTNNFMAYGFTPAPGFFNVTGYNVTLYPGLTNKVYHGLGAVPELILVKLSNAAGPIYVSAPGLLGSGSAGLAYEALNATGLYNPGNTASTTFIQSTSNVTSDYVIIGHASTASSVGKAANSYYTMITFATLAGVSKVGTVDVDGTSNYNVNCGFAGSARFIWMKMVNSTTDWMLFDTVRGINTSAVDPFFKTSNTSYTEASSDVIDPFTTGFTLKSSIFGAAGKVLYLAIA